MFWVVARWLLGCSGVVARRLARVFWVVARVLLCVARVFWMVARWLLGVFWVLLGRC